MRTCITTVVRSVLLAILIGALPPAIAAATETPAAAPHQEVKADTHAAAPAAAGHEVAADTHGAKADAHGDAGHGEAHGGSLSPEKLKDLFWRAVNFLALVVILVKFGAKPIMSGLSGRQQQIREELEDLTARRDEAERAYKDFEVKLAGMEKEMELIVERAIAQAQVEKERILADAEKAAEDIKRQAEAAVQAELEDAKRILREEIAEQAAAMAEELIVKNLTPADQVAITEQYLERVGAVQ
ncbi:H+transporting two-sector ATPase B/B' subunit [Desulfobulbus propionicus DSM 2032]|uniref:ATP synthase subunit b n=1 Tax=Desulfobulbus propionicus (strain ATCC 33891 / DSM 2032 / VKM B-1956 / 1pr3) TaxID=577650 RepID=A0A7U4DQ96_DESPD|nr:ATP synthase F0 subunit B [Desulfobulbus propionicus]ADW18792.1 H+transporting two-sector ATPase B/B' subunit [Desulfobulbus propionicus DSM 2032]